MRYYAIIDGQKTAPLEPAELVMTHNINESTLVWCSGMSDWTPVRDVAEIASLIQPAYPDIEDSPTVFTENPTPPSAPDPNPAYQQPQYQQPYQQQPYQQSQYQQPYQQSQYQQPYQQPHHQQPYQQPHQQQPYQQSQYQQPYQQPSYGGGYNAGMNVQNVDRGKPFNWMVWAIITTVIGLGFYIIGAVPGIIGIVYSANAQSKYRMGDYIGAYKDNNVAKILTIIGMCISSLVIIGLVIFIGLAATYVSYLPDL